MIKLPTYFPDKTENKRRAAMIYAALCREPQESSSSAYSGIPPIFNAELRTANQLVSSLQEDYRFPVKMSLQHYFTAEWNHPVLPLLNRLGPESQPWVKKMITFLASGKIEGLESPDPDPPEPETRPLQGQITFCAA